MPFNNLPGIIQEELDGNLTVTPINDNPIVLVLGTAAQGPSETVYRVDRVSDAARVFGKTSGTLARGLFEVSLAGALNIRLMRIGATPSSLTNIGTPSTGFTVTTLAKDNTAGDDYSIFYEGSTQRLRVFRVSDGELVYDNNPAYPSEAIDLNEVAVSGSATGGTDIGTLANPVTLRNADGAGAGPADFTQGSDGLELSRMQLWEALYNAYVLLEDQEADVVVPMNAYLDAPNVMDLTDAERTALALASLAAYPTAAATNDVLGKVFVQEFEGENLFWWWFPSDIDADADSTFTTDSGANIFPAKGSASALLDAFGDPLTGSDFHEVNFAYQLANFCYTQSRDQDSKTGVVGVMPPASYSPKDVSEWIGRLPETDEDSNGNIVVASGGNGTGLLGNKFMSGRIGASGMPAYTVNGVAGLFNGGFIATDSGFLDDAQLTDDNDHLIDIGKYLSVVATYPVLSNPSRATSYTASGAPSYGGFYSALPAVSAPTNKLLRSLRLPFRVGLAKLDLLAGQRYVTFHSKSRGIVVSDAPTAARPDSDYQRLSTVRQVKAAVDAIRRAGEPFLGEGMTGALVAALDTAIDSQLKGLVKGGLIRSYRHQVISTPQQQVLGQATVELRLVPAFELRQITVVVALAAV